MDTHGQRQDILVLRAPATVTADGNAPGVDLRGYEGQIAIHQSIGAVTGTSPTLSAKIQHSDDNSAFEDVPNAAFAEATATGAQTLVLRKDGLKRYVRHVADVGGTSPSFPVSVVATVIPKYPS